MKTKILLILFFLGVVTAGAQNTKIIYIDASKTNKKHTSNNNKDIIKLRALQSLNKAESLKKNIKFELIYNDEKSVFKRVETLIPNGEEIYYALAFVSVPLGSYFFKDSKEKYKIKQKSGDVFKIIYPHKQYNWEITNETKVILNYKCYKATTVYKEFDFGRDMEMEKSYTAWFTYDLNLPYGPFGLTGLPGVVLEGREEGVGFSKLHLKAKEIKTTKEFPKIPKGIKIDFVAFNKLLGEYYKEIRRK